MSAEHLDWLALDAYIHPMDYLTGNESLIYFAAKSKHERLFCALHSPAREREDFEAMIEIAMAIEDSPSPEDTQRVLFSFSPDEFRMLLIGFPPPPFDTRDGTNKCIEDFRPVTPIWIAASKGDAERTRELIETGAVEKHIMDRLMKAAESSANKTILTTLKTALNAAGGLSDAS